MIPNKNYFDFKSAKFSILEEGDEIEKGDEFYNPFKDEWQPVDEEFIGANYYFDESKPVRRKNSEYLN